MCVYVCIHLYTYIDTPIYIHIHTRVYIYIHTYTYAHTQTLGRLWWSETWKRRNFCAGLEGTFSPSIIVCEIRPRFFCYFCFWMERIFFFGGNVFFFGWNDNRLQNPSKVSLHFLPFFVWRDCTHTRTHTHTHTHTYTHIHTTSRYALQAKGHKIIQLL